MLKYTKACDLLRDKKNIRIVEMSMNDAWFRDTGPTVSMIVLLLPFFM